MVRQSPDHNAARLKEFINRRAGSETYLVGHSLGGVQTLQRFSDLPIDKVVCLGSPLADTEVSLLC
jgi:pimeloyl-ACP methyl ester carboxylesterase